MKDELTRQTELAWKRGRAYGFFLGVIYTSLALILINLLIAF